MNGPLLAGIISVTIAMLLYTSGTMKNLFSKKVNFWAANLLWAGLMFDITGTICMITISPGFVIDFHSIIGFTALGLMAVKALILTLNNRKIIAFHGVKLKIFSLAVWLLWMSVFISGSSKM